MSRIGAATKIRQFIFVFSLDRDNRSNMPSLNPRSEHPLAADQELLSEVLDIMYAKIHKVLGWPNPGLARGGRHPMGAGSEERTLPGTMVSADDILARAYQALMRNPQASIRNWKAWAVTIARNKAIEALRAAGPFLAGPGRRPDLELVSGDEEHRDSTGEPRGRLFEVLSDSRRDPEAEYIALRNVLDLEELAREVLSDRDLQILFAIYQGYSRSEVGEIHGLTRQRVGQIFEAAMQRLESDPRFPYPIKQQDDQQGGPKSHDE